MSSEGTPRFAGIDDKNETFVYKLYRMVEDPAHQHLLSWSPSGQSFVVLSGTECARDVLPKYFKHNNFSSFVRQLNMYGFHKINESPRNPRSNVDQQVWEFSHPRFLRGRTDLLADIRRKVVASGSGGRSPPHFSQDLDMDSSVGASTGSGSAPGSYSNPTVVTPAGGATSPSFHHASLGVHRSFDDSEPPSSIEVMQAFQNEILRQLAEMQDTMQILFHEAAETRRQLGVYQQATRKLIESLSRQQAIMPAGLPRAFEAHEFAFLIEEHRRTTADVYQAPAIVVSSESPQFAKVPIVHNLPPAGSFYPSFAQGAMAPEPGHRRTSSFVNAINTPLPPSPTASPYGSPHGSPHPHSPPLEYMTEEGFAKNEA